MGVWAVLLLTLIVGSCLGAPPSPTGTKRSDENIQFGNQQNKPVSVLDEDALPGAFPSSETTETGDPETPTANPAEEEEEDENEDEHIINKDEDEEDEPREEPPSPPSLEEHRHLEPVSQHLNHLRQPPLHREEMIRDLPPVALASRWRSPSQFYSITDWAMPISPMYGGGGGGGDDGSFPSRRRRRSTEHKGPAPDPKKILQVSLHALRTGHRHKREIPEVRRIRRDLSNIDLEKLRREVDIVELLAMLARPPQHRNPGFATVTYAPLAPSPPRFAPQPKLFPDYDEEEEDEEEDDDRVGFQRQSVRPPPPPPLQQQQQQQQQQQPDPGMYPAGGRVWRRSGGYGLSTVPGFKRSAFRANTPPPPMRALNPGDVYSLAAMLGAELDPATHRLRRAAM